MRTGWQAAQRGRWILAIVVGLAFFAACSYALVRAQRFADRRPLTSYAVYRLVRRPR